MDKVAFVTGAAGMAGSSLIDYILENHPEYKIIACIRRHSNQENIKHLYDAGLVGNRVIFEQLNLEDSHEVNRSIEFHQPTKLFALGAQSYVPQSWKSPVETIETNIIGAVNILEAVRRFAKDCVVQLAGSSEQYGLVYPDEIPIKEINPFRTLSPYAVTKVAQENLGFVYYRSYGIKTILTRAFNHFCSRRGVEFVEAKIAKQAVEISLGLREKFSLGNLDAIRDFTDARDVVRCYWLLTEEAEKGNTEVIANPFNICSGQGYTIRQILEKICKLLNIEPIIEQDIDSLRPGKADVPRLIGDCSKVEKIIGKVNTILLDDSLSALIDRWNFELTGEMDKIFIYGK